MKLIIENENGKWRVFEETTPEQFKELDPSLCGFPES